MDNYNFDTFSKSCYTAMNDWEKIFWLIEKNY